MPTRPATARDFREIALCPDTIRQVINIITRFVSREQRKPHYFVSAVFLKCKAQVSAHFLELRGVAPTQRRPWGVGLRVAAWRLWPSTNLLESLRDVHAGKAGHLFR